LRSTLRCCGFYAALRERSYYGVLRRSLVPLQLAVPFFLPLRSHRVRCLVHHCVFTVHVSAVLQFVLVGAFSAAAPHQDTFFTYVLPVPRFRLQRLVVSSGRCVHLLFTGRYAGRFAFRASFSLFRLVDDSFYRAHVGSFARLTRLRYAAFAALRVVTDVTIVPTRHACALVLLCVPDCAPFAFYSSVDT